MGLSLYLLDIRLIILSLARLGNASIPTPGARRLEGIPNPPEV